jgi:hypothetical protein
MCAAIQDLLVNRLWQRRPVDHRTGNILQPVRMDSGRSAASHCGKLGLAARDSVYWLFVDLSTV